MRFSRTPALFLSAVAVAFLAGRATSTTQDAEGGVIESALAKVGTPGKMHRRLDPFEGEFDTHMTAWIDPSGDPVQTTGVMKSSWVMGGKFLKQEYEGEFMGKPFVGVGYMGYSNVDEVYQLVWLDSLTTKLYFTTQEASDDGLTFIAEGEEPDPITGVRYRFKDVTRVSPDGYRFTRYIDTQGEMVRVTEAVYTRR